LDDLLDFSVDTPSHDSAVMPTLKLTLPPPGNFSSCPSDIPIASLFASPPSFSATLSPTTGRLSFRRKPSPFFPSSFFPSPLTVRIGRVNFSQVFFNPLTSLGSQSSPTFSSSYIFRRQESCISTWPVMVVFPLLELFLLTLTFCPRFLSSTIPQRSFRCSFSPPTFPIMAFLEYFPLRICNPS